MKILRTPESRFAELPGFPFEPRYVEIDGFRIHYVDEGGPAASTVLLMHGEPTWSYLYRHMIPPIVGAGLRAVAPDFVGFGRSDKPARIRDLSYAAHVRWMHGFLDALDLHDITLVCQDWGSLVGLRLAAEQPDRFARIVLANGGLPTGEQQMPRAFRYWRAFARWSPWFPVGRIVQSGTVRRLSPGEIRAYDAPFPSFRYKAAARAFPRLVPATPGDPARADNLAAWQVLERWQKPFLTAFSNRDPITRGGYRTFQERVPGCAGQAHTVMKNGGHFLQEDLGPELAGVVIEFVRANPPAG
ncbi:MAG: haloalkane dehalogenase [Gammaproteobacteria bacterium]|nr:haloalkane dehalogenase [Gammaproteobacteria bacterium]MDH5309020.1 haloalkane dehalogenase [Gammaproteobacteria bacterium]